MKNFLTRISIFFDILKDFLVAVLVTVLILLFTTGIAHNLLKINEVSGKYTGEYKNLYNAGNNRMMNIYTIGQGDKTLVILSGFGLQSPVIEYKSFARNLSSDCRVVIVEYLGYGYSLKAETNRTSENIVKEVRMALADAGIYGPYTLVPHSISNIYAIKYQELYPDEVSAIISIDGLMPNMSKEQAFIKEINSSKTNIQVSSIAEFTGFARVLSYVKPELFYIDKMQADSNYTAEDIKEFRKRIGIGYLTGSMVKEINKLQENLMAEKEYVYPNYLPVLEILTTESVEKYKEQKNQNIISKDYEEYANNMLSNPVLQRVQVIEGNHMVPVTNPSSVAQMIKEFIKTY